MEQWSSIKRTAKARCPFCLRMQTIPFPVEIGTAVVCSWCNVTGVVETGGPLATKEEPYHVMWCYEEGGE